MFEFDQNFVVSQTCVAMLGGLRESQQQPCIMHATEYQLSEELQANISPCVPTFRRHSAKHNATNVCAPLQTTACLDQKENSLCALSLAVRTPSPELLLQANWAASDC